MKNIKYILAFLLLPFALVVTGCSSPASSEPVDLTGNWSYSEDSVKFQAQVKGDTIQIVLALDDTEALYWLGTFPEDAKDGDTLTSGGNVEALAESLYGSTDEKKVFDFKNGELHFDFTIMGVTKDIALKR